MSETSSSLMVQMGWKERLLENDLSAREINSQCFRKFVLDRRKNW